jgi:hypothetical protein
MTRNAIVLFGRSTSAELFGPVKHEEWFEIVGDEGIKYDKPEA